MSNSKKNKTPLLKIRGLKIQGFSDERWHEIIKGIDLTLNRGEVLGLIGESGAGKSTLIDIICGFLNPTQGQIFVDEKKIDRLSDTDWLKRIGLLTQESTNKAR